jgi:hypothetical protein
VNHINKKESCISTNKISYWYLLLVSRKISGFDREGVGPREAEHVLELSVPGHRVCVGLLVDKLLVGQVVNLRRNFFFSRVYNYHFYS